MSFEILEGEQAGFDMGGWRMPNGVIRLSSSSGTRHIAEWPEEIRFHGATYTLEDVVHGSIDEVGARWENAIYA